MGYKRKDSNNRVWGHIIGGISLCIGGAILAYYKLPRVPLKEYTKICQYLAVMDDEICRNELDGNYIENEKIVFPSKRDSLQYKYHLFLETYKRFSLQELEEEFSKFEKKLEESRQYIYEENVELQVELQKNNG